MAWVHAVSDACEWKTHFEPKEIVYALCEIIDAEIQANPPPQEYEYLCFHAPSKLWVRLQNRNRILLVDSPKKASRFPNKEKLARALKKASLHDSPHYGLENFLEFEAFLKPKTNSHSPIRS